MLDINAWFNVKYMCWFSYSLNVCFSAVMKVFMLLWRMLMSINFSSGGVFKLMLTARALILFKQNMERCPKRERNWLDLANSRRWYLLSSYFQSVIKHILPFQVTQWWHCCWWRMWRQKILMTSTRCWWRFWSF